MLLMWKLKSRYYVRSGCGLLLVTSDVGSLDQLLRAPRVHCAVVRTFAKPWPHISISRTSVELILPDLSALFATEMAPSLAWSCPPAHSLAIQSTPELAVQHVDCVTAIRFTHSPNIRDTWISIPAQHYCVCIPSSLFSYLGGDSSQSLARHGHPTAGPPLGHYRGLEEGREEESIWSVNICPERQKDAV